jgi:hypothetical protein
MRRYEKGKEILKKERNKEKHNIQKRNLFGLHVLNYY